MSIRWCLFGEHEFALDTVEVNYIPIVGYVGCRKCFAEKASRIIEAAQAKRKADSESHPNPEPKKVPVPPTEH